MLFGGAATERSLRPPGSFAVPPRTLDPAPDAIATAGSARVLNASTRSL